MEDQLSHVTSHLYARSIEMDNRYYTYFRNQNRLLVERDRDRSREAENTM